MATAKNMSAIRAVFVAYNAQTGTAMATWGSNNYGDVGSYRGKIYKVNGAAVTIPATGAMDYTTLAGHADAIASNCTVNCNCANSCSATCFPAGSKVLMADFTWRNIEAVRAGDMVMSSNGPARVVRLDTPTLGQRKLFRMQDGSITWSAEHTFWVNRDGQHWLWSLDVKHLEWEASLGDIGGVKDFGSYFVGEDRQSEFFAYLGASPWKKGRPVHIEEADHTPELPLFLPITENGELIIVNGYLVGAGVNEHACDYTKLDWPNVYDAIKGALFYRSLKG